VLKKGKPCWCKQSINQLKFRGTAGQKQGMRVAHQQTGSGKAPVSYEGYGVNETELNKWKAMLSARRAELALTLREREGIAIEKTSDQLDDVQLAAERELLLRALERSSDLLRNIREALNRIGHGTYGICAQCEEAISTKRLNALPWTPLCIKCQENADCESRADTHNQVLSSTNAA